MCDEEENDMLAEAIPSKRKSIRKPIIKKSKFSKMSKNDWIEANEQTKQNRGISGITYKDIFGEKI